MMMHNETDCAQGTTIQNSTYDFDKGCEKRRRFWLIDDEEEEEIEITDTMIISDERQPQAKKNGKHYTLWSKNHNDNTLLDSSGNKGKISSNFYYEA